MNITLTIDRTELALADLVITSVPFATAYHIPEDGTSWPRFTTRRSYAPTSAFVPGELMLGSVTDAGDWPLTIYANGADAAALSTAMDALEAALTQSAFEVTLDVNGVTRTYPADPEFPDWGEIDSGMARAFIAKASVTLQVNPEV